MNWKRSLLRFLVFILIMEGISSFWRFTDVVMFGESQKSAVDAIATVLMTFWIDNRIWGE